MAHPVWLEDTWGHQHLPPPALSWTLWLPAVPRRSTLVPTISYFLSRLVSSQESLGMLER